MRENLTVWVCDSLVHSDCLVGIFVFQSNTVSKSTKFEVKYLSALRDFVRSFALRYNCKNKVKRKVQYISSWEHKHRCFAVDVVREEALCLRTENIDDGEKQHCDYV